MPANSTTPYRVRRALPLPIASLLLLVLAVVSLPAHAQPAEQPRCFAETGHCISGRIRAFWEAGGGLPVFGLPISPQQEAMIEGTPRQVQWFERTRLELHPDNAPPFDVLLGRLGAEQLARQTTPPMPAPDFPPGTTCRSFAETGQQVCGGLLQFWQSYGVEQDGVAGSNAAESLALFGLPLTPAQNEQLADGQTYTVQWFERARLELHPDNAPPFDVLAGRLGAERYAPATAPPKATPTPAPALLTGAAIAYHASAADGTFDIFLISPDGRVQRNLTNHPANDLYPAWAPDGQQLVFASDRDSPTAGRFDLYRINRDGSGLTRLTNTPQSREEFPAWSPDGNWIAYVSDATGNQQIYARTLDGSQQVQLTTDASNSSAPAWSPDGRQIAFMSDRGRRDYELYTMQRDGSNQQQLEQTAANEAYPAWSPDGQRLLLASGRDGNWKLYTLGLVDRVLTNLTNPQTANDTRPAWSPDGSQIVFQSDRAGSTDLYVMNNDGSDVRRITSGSGREASPAWSPDP